MKLRFAVDQAACFRKGIDCPKSIVTIEVHPGEIPPAERNLIADRLSGIDVCQLWNSGDGTKKLQSIAGMPVHIVAESPDYAGLMAAVLKDDTEAQTRQDRHRSIALATAEVGLDARALVEAHANRPK